MKSLVLVGTALLLSTTSAQAAVVTVKGSYAGACYDAAEDKRATIDNIQLCDRALEGDLLSPQDLVATHVNRGILEMMRGDFPAAKADFDAALARDPNQAEAWLNKAMLALNQGDSRSAAQLAERALQLNTQRPGMAFFIRGVANEDAGNLTAAYGDLVRAAKLEPDWSLPRQELKRYRVSTP